MRYRKINSLDDFSRDVAVVVEFIGQKSTGKRWKRSELI